MLQLLWSCKPKIVYWQLCKINPCHIVLQPPGGFTQLFIGANVYFYLFFHLLIHCLKILVFFQIIVLNSY